MNEHLKEFALRVRTHELFKGWMEELEKQRPVVPEYRPQETRDAEHALLERIKYETARQQGFDLFRLYLTGEK